MSKRFSDTEIWKKKWFCDLSPGLKSFWRYICDNCDNSGVWETNLPLAEFQIGCKLDIDDILDKFSGNIVQISQNKLLVVDFVKFQYGELKESCVPHRNVFALLKKHGIPYPIQYPIPYPIDRVQDKDKDKDKDKDIYNYIKYNYNYSNGHEAGAKTWQNDYPTYMNECEKAFDALCSDWDWIAERKEYHKGLNILKSLEKMYVDYWSTKAGWKNKKNAARGKPDYVIDWKATAANGLTMKCNQVWLRNNEFDNEKRTIEMMMKRKEEEKNETSTKQ